MKRRHFLLATIGFSASATLNARSLPAVRFTPNDRLGIDDHHWHVFDEAMDHLMPSEEQSPGAKDVHATAWFHNALVMPDVTTEHLALMRNGVQLLEKTSLKLFKQSFVTLGHAEREQALRTLEEDHRGKAWIRETLRYILEAMLSDPVYGGNPDGIGWKWLAHRPGFPRPPKNKRYFLL